MAACFERPGRREGPGFSRALVLEVVRAVPQRCAEPCQQPRCRARSPQRGLELINPLRLDPLVEFIFPKTSPGLSEVRHWVGSPVSSRP